MVKQEAAHLCGIGYICYPVRVGAVGNRPIAPQTKEAPVSESGSAVTPIEEKTATAKAVYILYVVGWLIPIIAPIVGVILAYIHREDAPPWLRTHYELQIRTFAIGLLFFVISVVTSMISIYIASLLMVLTLIWTTVRCAKGLKLVYAGAPYDNPETWLW
jgi:uncharacterized membrane protein